MIKFVWGRQFPRAMVFVHCVFVCSCCRLTTVLPLVRNPSRQSVCKLYSSEGGRLVLWPFEHREKNIRSSLVSSLLRIRHCDYLIRSWIGAPKGAPFHLQQYTEHASFLAGLLFLPGEGGRAYGELGRSRSESGG